MKELSIEQKAKAYDEAIDKAKKELDACGSQDCDAARQIFRLFSELKESEDERMRKEIIAFLTYYHTGQGNSVEYNDDWIAWLEKQGEQKPIESMPEFKEGDILYNKDSYASDSIFIFKGMSDKTNAYLCYARLYDKKDFSVYSKEDWDEGVGIYGGEFYPANHKQKELLFSEIEKAGYKWNPDEKKMEKIEQKSTWSEEDETGLTNTIIMLKEGASLHFNKKDITKAVNWLKALKDKVLLQPQQKLGEKDKGNLLDVKCIIDEVWHNQYVRETIDHSCEELESLWHWLDNIWQRVEYPQTTWKPSDEQMKALSAMKRYCEIATSFDAYKQEIVESLYQDLKKLREG